MHFVCTNEFNKQDPDNLQFEPCGCMTMLMMGQEVNGSSFLKVHDIINTTPVIQYFLDGPVCMQFRHQELVTMLSDQQMTGIYLEYLTTTIYYLTVQQL